MLSDRDTLTEVHELPCHGSCASAEVVFGRDDGRGPRCRYSWCRQRIYFAGGAR
jgi:hypothetical protein